MNKFLKNIIYNFPIPLKRYIILESNPDLSDNTYALYKEFLKNKVNEKYKIFWFVDDKDKFKNINVKNVYFINCFGKIKFHEKLKSKYINLRAKYIIDCNKIIYKKNKNQKRLYLGHGMPYKVVSEYCSSIGYVDYMVSLSPFFDDKLSSITFTKENKMIDLGFPRNDDLFSKSKDIRFIFKDKSYKKVIVWLPTYRQRVNKDSNLSMDNSFELGLPVIYNVENLKEINNLLKKLDILLVLKPHPAQDLSVIKAEDLSNFVILTNKDLQNADINLYEFLGQTDGLITDYSSVYYDYLLTDKPIAITTDDLEEYKKVFEFVYDDIFKVIKGEYINNIEDFKTFLNNISTGNDIAKEARLNAKKTLHKFQDGNSSKRVYDFLVNNMEL